MHRVQVQASLSTPVFCFCEKALLEARWHEGFKCTCCSGQRASRFLRGQQTYWQRSIYRRQTSLHTGTVFDNSKLPLKLPLTIWFVALYLLTKGKINLAALELMRHPVAAAFHACTAMKRASGRATAKTQGARWVNIVLGNVRRALDGLTMPLFFKYAEPYLRESA